jgi:hypothetical protein
MEITCTTTGVSATIAAEVLFCMPNADNSQKHGQSLFESRVHKRVALTITPFSNIRFSNRTSPEMRLEGKKR